MGSDQFLFSTDPHCALRGGLHGGLFRVPDPSCRLPAECAANKSPRLPVPLPASVPFGPAVPYTYSPSALDFCKRSSVVSGSMYLWKVNKSSQSPLNECDLSPFVSQSSASRNRVDSCFLMVEYDTQAGTS